MTNKINGIDVSEEIRYCNNCSNLGLDFKTGKFYCGLSNRKDELPEILSCENFSSNCYIKRLQKENEGLKKRCEELDKMTGIFSVRLANKYKQALEEIRELVSNEIDKTDKDDELMQIYGTIYNRCNEVLNDRD